MKGDGTLNIAGGTIERKSSGAVIRSVMYEKTTILVSGDAKVISTGLYSDAISVDGNVTVTGSAVIETRGIEGEAIFSRGNITVSGNAKVIDAGTGNMGVNSYYGDITVTDNAVIFTSSHGISTDSGSITLSGNARVMSTEDGACAIDCGSGAVYILGNAAVEATGNINDPQSAAINVSGNGIVTVSGGTVTASGDGGAALRTSGGRIKVEGGTVSATKPTDYAIYIDRWPRGGGVAAYLAGTCSGMMFADVDFNEGKITQIVEVSSLNIPASYLGGQGGLTKKAGDGFTYKWIDSSGSPAIQFESSDGQSRSARLCLRPNCQINIGFPTVSATDSRQVQWWQNDQCQHGFGRWILLTNIYSSYHAAIMFSFDEVNKT